jgi:hypothetical protein
MTMTQTTTKFETTVFGTDEISRSLDLERMVRVTVIRGGQYRPIAYNVYPDGTPWIHLVENFVGCATIRRTAKNASKYDQLVRVATEALAAT